MSETEEPSVPASQDRRGALIANERTKLSATYANGLAISIFAVGGLAPVFNVIYGSIPVLVPTGSYSSVPAFAGS